MEVIYLDRFPWDEFHHHSSVSLQTELGSYPLQILSIDLPDIVPSPFTTIHEIDAEEKLGNLFKTMLINILIKINVVENI